MLSRNTRTQSTAAGIMIVLAYSMLLYTATGNIPLGLVTDIISGLCVIGIAVIFYPHFRRSVGNSLVNRAYLVFRYLEGLIMILGGILLIMPRFEPYRDLIYSHIHIHFFNLGALFFYLLLYRSAIIPKFISLWGLIATFLLMIMTASDIIGIALPFSFILILPIILNELFLAGWLIVKGIQSPDQGGALHENS